jgi:hypothetical protein
METPAVAQVSVGDTAFVTWDANADSDLAGYKFYWGTVSGVYSYRVELPVNWNHFELWGYPRKVVIYAAVTAFDFARNESGYSNEVSFVSGMVAIDSCDLNGNGRRGPEDFAAFRVAYGSKRGNLRFNARADFNGDGRIDGKDHLWYARKCR